LWKLDIQTGELLDEIEHEYFDAHQETISFDTVTGNIIILCFDLYACFSIDQRQLVKELILPTSIRVIKSKFDKDNKIALLFKTMSSFAANAYGFFDMESQEIIFQQEMIVEEGYLHMLPQVNEELFTILDAKGNLIIHKIKDIL